MAIYENDFSDAEELLGQPPT